MSATDSLPTTPVELTSALYAAGTLQQGAIERVEITERIQTPISNLWFLEVIYDSQCSPELPRHLLLKWALEESPAPERGDPELVFYRELAPSLPSPPIVRCLGTAPPDSNERWIVLEDLRASHTNPPWPKRPANKLAHDAVRALARLHTHWWEAPTLGSTVGTLHTETKLRTMVHGFRDHLPAFFDDLGEDLPPSDRMVLETVFNSSLRPWLRLLELRAHGHPRRRSYVELSVPSVGAWRNVSNRLANLASRRRASGSRLSDRFALGSHRAETAGVSIASHLLRRADRRRRQQLFVRRSVAGLSSLCGAKSNVSNYSLVSGSTTRVLASSSRLCSCSVSRSRWCRTLVGGVVSKEGVDEYRDVARLLPGPSGCHRGC